MRTFICAFLYLIFFLVLHEVGIGRVTFTQISLIFKVLICVCAALMGSGIFMAFMQDLEEIIG